MQNTPHNTISSEPLFSVLIAKKSGEGYRVVGELKMIDFVMNNGFWIGVYPGMTSEMLQWMITSIKEFCSNHH